MKVAAAFTLLAAASVSANVIPSGTAPLYPMGAVTSSGGPGTGYFYSSIPTPYPTNGGAGTGTGTGTGAFPPAPTNGTYSPTGTAPRPTGGATPPPPPSQTTAPPISGASRNGVGFLALAGAAAAYVLS
ncbi:hypothetical protein SLS62_000786 [Diatrype stigma]|uniref:Uncharacterized protein n=1 Tax=Diatrype stigma TaxID=117547 RepID=A0AAN9V2H7_9PEZI